MKLGVHIVMLALTILVAPALSAETTDALLQSGVRALQAEKYPSARRFLEKAYIAGDDPRAIYYYAFALEKTGACKQAQQRYREAAVREDVPQGLRTTAVDALIGFESRCEGTSRRPDAREVVVHRPPTGWVVLGWTTTVVGSLVLLALPVKTTAERSSASTIEEYFLQRYGCEVSFGQIENSTCDEASLKADDVYSEYDAHVTSARRTTTVMLITGGSLAAAGAITLATVAATSKKPSVSAFVSPSGELGVTWSVRF